MTKKKILTLCIGIAIISLLIIMLFLYGVFTPIPNIEDVDNNKLLDFKQKYIDLQSYDLTIDDVYVDKYLGTYHDCIVAIISDTKAFYTQAIRFVNIGGVNLVFSDSKQVLVYKDGDIYTLEDAYSLKILSKLNIISVRNAL